jgi:hypothetical protein
MIAKVIIIGANNWFWPKSLSQESFRFQLVHIVFIAHMDSLCCFKISSAFQFQFPTSQQVSFRTVPIYNWQQVSTREMDWDNSGLRSQIFMRKIQSDVRDTSSWQVTMPEKDSVCAVIICKSVFNSIFSGKLQTFKLERRSTEGRRR